MCHLSLVGGVGSGPCRCGGTGALAEPTVRLCRVWTAGAGAVSGGTYRALGDGVRRRNLPRRLERMEARIGGQRRGAPAQTVDFSHLTVAELEELERLAAKTRRLPTGRWDFSALDDAELDQLRDLVAKGQAVLPHESGERRRG